MKCPYCNKEMYHPVGKPTWSCQNWDCLKSEGMIGNHVLWQELIRTRKALDMAKKALNDIQFTDDGNQIVDIRSFAHHALDQITALEQIKITMQERPNDN